MPRLLLDEVHLRLDPRMQIARLGIGQQQLVEIAKALSHEARILVLDEPTAALTDAEVETLFAILNKLQARGVGMVYISHKLHEVFQISDRITVLRDGRTVGTEPTKTLDEARVIARMVGREVTDIFPATHHQPEAVVFEARGVTVEDPNVPGKRLVNNVSFVNGSAIIDELWTSLTPPLVYGEIASSALVPDWLSGRGNCWKSRSASNPARPATLEPSLKPEPA